MSGERGPVLVTGGGGFLGSAIVRLLRERGATVRSLARNDYPRLDELGVEQHRGDLIDAEAVSRAVAGCETVFHVAAKAGIWGPYRDYYRANVLGTENVIAACHEHGVRRLIYTGSPSVVFTGHDLEEWTSRFRMLTTTTRPIRPLRPLRRSGCWPATTTRWRPWRSAPT
ncbi:MAG: NAD-dependent epimerase/dehydratase family protein [Isosphaeraceae bacterium]